MKPIATQQTNTIYKGDGYGDLPAIKTDIGVVTVWELTLWETVKMVFTRKIYLSQLNFDKPLQPIKLSTDLYDLIDKEQK